MAEISEPARECDLRDAIACVQRVGQVSPALFQPPLPDPLADRALLRVEQILKVAGRNADKARNLALTVAEKVRSYWQSWEPDKSPERGRDDEGGLER